MKKILAVLIVCMMSMGTLAFAEEPQETTETHKSFFQLGFLTYFGSTFDFVSPLGTNGSESPFTINTISINILGGYSYGNTLLEIGGLYNINKNITRGLQIAGVFNYTGDFSEKTGYIDNAIQIAGFANFVVAGNVFVQISSLINLAPDVQGIQIGGGLVNMAPDVQGIQIGGGVANFARSVQGVQIGGGIFNFVGHGVAGVQLGGGLVNFANWVTGVQLGGSIFNVALLGVYGIQIGGLINGSLSNVYGVQIGGLFNYARKLTGVQIGLANYTEEISGVQIGLVNIVKHGGKLDFELSFSDSFTTALSFKSGTDYFYTIISGGINYLPTSSVEYAWGLGIGTDIDWVEGWGNQIELLGYTVTENGKYPIDFISNLYQLKLTVSKKLSNHFELFAGPVLNLSVSNYKNPQTGDFGSSLAPWSMWKTDFKGNQLNSWVGGSAGVRVSL